METQKKWARIGTKNSHALRMEEGVFEKKASSLFKKVRRKSKKRKVSPFRSAMSMLTFYINRAGKSPPKEELKRLEKAKKQLRRVYRKAQ